jgi:hypothetical protein
LVNRSNPDPIKVINVLTAHAVSHEGLANNHELCNPPIGHGLEPKIFWVLVDGTGVAEERISRFPADPEPDG